MNEEKSALTLTPDAGAEELARAIVSVLDARKARDIRMLNVEKQTSLTEYFVICNGTSRTQIKALSDEVQYKLAQCGIQPLHVEGNGSGGWILIDFGHVIVHIFSTDARQFYNLEKLYAGTSQCDISELIHED